MKVGDILKTANDGRNRFYEVTGVYLGATNQESVVGLVPLDRKLPTAYKKNIAEMFVPVDLVFGETALFTPAD